MDEVRIGIVGASSRSSSFCAIVPQVKGAKLVAICDKIQARLDTALRHCPEGTKGFLSYEEMLEKAGIDAVIVCTEPANFSPLTRIAMDAGKHVMIEVPFAQTIKDCWDLIVTVERSNLVFQMAEQIRYSPFVTAWQKMVQEGTLGKIVFAEGQYLHGLSPTHYYYDKVTGKQISYEETKGNPNAVRSRIWDTFPHCIYYSVHDISPLLKVLDDRIVEVSCFMSEPQSDVYPDLPASDVEVAMMRTAKGTIIRQVVTLNIPTPEGMRHWYHLMGTKGMVETPRANDEKGKMFLANSQMSDVSNVTWAYSWEYDRMLPVQEAWASGHSGLDYYPTYTFVRSILTGAPVEMDVYKAAETSMPVIVAMESAERGGVLLPVPDVRPNATRKLGEYPGNK